MTLIIIGTILFALVAIAAMVNMGVFGKRAYISDADFERRLGELDARIENA